MQLELTLSVMVLKREILVLVATDTLRAKDEIRTIKLYIPRV